jgi:hypothetical protein
MTTSTCHSNGYIFSDFNPGTTLLMGQAGPAIRAPKFQEIEAVFWMDDTLLIKTDFSLEKLQLRKLLNKIHVSGNL